MASWGTRHGQGLYPAFCLMPKGQLAGPCPGRSLVLGLGSSLPAASPFLGACQQLLMGDLELREGLKAVGLLGYTPAGLGVFPSLSVAPHLSVL